MSAIVFESPPPLWFTTIQNIKKTAFDLQGMEGEVAAVLTEWQGRPISANLPVLVKFEQRFKAHFRPDEVTLIED